MTGYDIVGYWTEIKLDIVRRYATEYSKILANQGVIRKHIYIDAFAGPGINLSRASGKYVPGSPLNALNVQPPFKGVPFH